MNYSNQEAWMYMQQRYPFYTPYSFQGNYEEYMEYEKDLERVKELYPTEVKRILQYVSKECDKMEYEGSLMYDEYPDRVMLKSVCKNIMDRIREDEENTTIKASGIDDLVEVLLYHEMYRRRCRRRRCNRWW